MVLLLQFELILFKNIKYSILLINNRKFELFDHDLNELAFTLIDIDGKSFSCSPELQKGDYFIFDKNRFF